MTVAERPSGRLVGRRISADGAKGTVLFEGAVGATRGTWLGVEWDNPARGKHRGEHEGVVYFSPRGDSPTGCSFIRHDKVELGVDLFAGVEAKYGRVEGETAGVDHTEIRNLQKEIGARFVQLVGFDKVNQDQSQLDKLRTVSLQGRNVNDAYVEIGSRLPALRELDLRESLVSSWGRLGVLVSQVPLQVLNVSANYLPVSPGCLSVASFAHLTHLVIGELGYTWSEVEVVAGDLPRLAVLQAHNNKIGDVTVGEGKFPVLEELDLDGNPLTSWKAAVNPLDRLARLRSLRLNGTGLVDIHLAPGSFANLRGLQLLDNNFHDWSSVAELSKVAITELRLRNCPLYTHVRDNTHCRSITIALMASLEMLNGSDITKAERRWAEIDYLKKHGGEYLRLKALSDPMEQAAEMEKFRASHGRYEEIVGKYGEPMEGEDRVQDTTLSAMLVAVTVRCPELPGSADTVKKLPTSMTVAKLKALLYRLYKKNIQGGEMRVSLVSSRSVDVEVELDNNMRELAYYSLEKGDTLLVRW